MTIPYPDDPSEPILRKALAKGTPDFVGVVGAASHIQHPIPIRLKFNKPELDRLTDAARLDRHLIEQPAGIHSNEPCPCTAGRHCLTDNPLSITLGNEEVGHLAFHPTGFNSLRTLSPQRRAFQVISGKRLACYRMELRLRGQPTRQHAGRPIYYADITLRPGTTLEKTLANARGTASRWFRADCPGQGHSIRLRQRCVRSQKR
jgi:hypothetical protein